MYLPKWEPNRDCVEREVSKVFDLFNFIPPAVFERGRPLEVLQRLSPSLITGSRYEALCGGEDLTGGEFNGAERMLVKEVNLGRIYDNVDGGGGGGGGGDGGRGGGNQLCRDKRARSGVT